MHIKPQNEFSGADPKSVQPEGANEISNKISEQMGERLIIHHQS